MENRVTEADEGNNCIQNPVIIQPVPPPIKSDLQVVGIDAPSAGISGQLIPISWTVENLGPNAADTSFWYDGIYLSRDRILDSNDYKVGHVVHQGNLGAHGTYTASENIMVPMGLSGPYYILVYTDSSSKVPESNENNNVSSGATALVIELPLSVDLIITEVNAPEIAFPGQNVTIAYRVVNQSGYDIRGSWHDALYLSKDRTWDIDDLFIGSVEHNNGLSASGSYQETVLTSLPASIPGPYYIIVRTDVRNNVRESNEENNFGASLTTTEFDIKDLFLDETHYSQLKNGEEHYFRLDVEGGEDILVTLDTDSQVSYTEIYIRYGDVPDRINYDFVYATPFRPDHEIIIPSAAAGTYYILVRGLLVPEGTVDYRLRAETLNFEIRSVVPGKGGNRGVTTLQINGAKYDHDIQPALLSQGGVEIPSHDVYFIDSTQIYARFDLTGSLPGFYNLILTNPTGSSAYKESALEVTEGQGGHLVTRLILAEAVRPGTVNTLWIEYSNTGDSDISAPLLTLSSSSGTPMRLINSDSFSSKPIQILGISFEGPAGILSPGSSYMIPVYFKTPNTSSRQFFSLRVMDKPDEPIDWITVEEQLKIPDVDPLVWERLWQALKLLVGDTWGSYVSVLQDNATRLSLRGEYVYDVRDLFGFEVGAARGGGNGVISGHVIYRDDGSLVKGVNVYAYQLDGPAFAQAITDGSGYFILENLVPGQYELQVENYVLTQSIQPVITENTDWLNQDVLVIRETEISGDVRDNTLPLKDVSVTVIGESSGHVEFAQTDENGHYVVRNLPEDTYQATASKEGYVEETISAILVRQGEIHDTVHFNLIRGATISGTVTDAFSHQSVEGAIVMASDENGSLFRAVTDSSGNYSITNLSAGSWLTSASSERHVKSEEIELATSVAGVVIQDFELVPGASISGKVADSYGNPVTGAGVYVEAVNGFNDSALTDEYGNYEIKGLEEGIYSVSIVADTFVPLKQDIGELLYGDIRNGVDFVLMSGSVVTGNVTEEDGITLIPGAELFFRANTGEIYTLVSEDNGAFNGNQFAPGIYYLSTSAYGYSMSQRMIEIPGNGVITNVNITLSKGGTISGVITESDGVTQVQKSVVQIFNGDGAQVSSTLSDDDGYYVFSSVVPGKYILRPFHNYLSFSSKEVELSTASTISCNFSAEKSTLTGTVVSSLTGETIKGASVTAMYKGDNQINEIHLMTETDIEGVYTFSSLIYGDYLLIVSADGYGTSIIDISVNSMEDLLKNVELSSSSVLSGKITDQESGLPVVGATISIADYNHAPYYPVFRTLSDEYGNYLFDNLSPGFYVIKIHADGYMLNESTQEINDMMTYDVSLFKGGFIIEGEVVDQKTGLPISNISVSLFSSGILIADTSTDNFGRFGFNNYPRGSYDIRVLSELGDTFSSISVNDNTHVILYLKINDALPYSAENFSESLNNPQSVVSFAANNTEPSLPHFHWDPDVNLIKAPSEFEAVTIPGEDKYTEIVEQNIPVDEPFCKVNRKVSELYKEIIKDRKYLINHYYYEYMNISELKRHIDNFEDQKYDKSNFQFTLWGIKLFFKPVAWVLGIWEYCVDIYELWKKGLENHENNMLSEEYAESAKNASKSLLGIGLNIIKEYPALMEKHSNLPVLSKILGVVKLIEKFVNIHTEYLNNIRSIHDQVNRANKKSAQLWATWTRFQNKLSEYRKLNKPCHRLILSTNPLHLGTVIAIPIKNSNVSENYVYMEGDQVEAMAAGSVGMGDKTYTFSHWSGAANSQSLNINVVINNLTYLTANYDEEVPDPDPIPDPPGDGGDDGSTDPRPPQDPNEKAGPAGFGPEGMIAADETIAYTIYFENVSDASGHASEVWITDGLDGDLDLRKFRLGEIAFGDTLIRVPESSSIFSSRLPLATGMLLEISAGLNVGSGEAQWHFKTIDPRTGDVPLDPMAGFLPPNDETHRGEGHVTFTIRPKPGLPTGTNIKNSASIVFDINEPIDTNEVSNVIDGKAPISVVNPLPTESVDPSFEVSWSGNDNTDGSGMANISIFVSQDEGPYEPWLINVKYTYATFTGTPGHTYCFYSIASDNAGNVELPPVEPDAVIYIISPNAAPYSPANPNPADGAIDITVNTGLSWSGGDPDPGDTVTYDVYLDTVNPPLNEASDNQSSTSYQAPLFAYNTTYYWKITAMDNSGAETEGPAWSFTTFTAQGDSDGDGLTNEEEIILGTNPHKSDTDGDGHGDGAEVDVGSDPKDPESVPMNVTVHLRRDFNLISAPSNTNFIPDAFTFMSIIDSSGIRVEKVERYDAVTGKVEEAFYQQDGSPGGTNFTIVPGEGLVIYVKEDMDINLSQNICPEFNLRAGTNWAGTPCQSVYASAYALLQAIGNESLISSIQRFNTDTGKFEAAGYINGQPSGVDFPIEAGEGYFIYMKQDVNGFTP